MKKIIMLLMSLVLLLSIVSPSLSGGGVQAATNDGKTIHTAIPVTVSTALKGDLSSNQSIFYKVTIPDNGELTATMTNTQDEVDVTIMNGDQEIYTDFTTPTNVVGETKTSVGLNKGDIVYIKIYNDYYSSQVSYNVRLSFTKGDNFEREYNNDIFHPNDIKLNSKTKGFVHTKNDSDYFKFELGKPGKVTIKLDNATIEKTADILDGNRNVYASLESDPTRSGLSSYDVGLPAGTYYLKLSTDEYTYDNISYQLDLLYTAGDNYEKEPNGKFLTANPIKLNTNYKAWIDYGVYDSDYYSFKLSKRETIKISMSHGEPDMDLYNQNYSHLAEIETDDSKSGYATYTTTLGAGTYYLYVQNDYDYRNIAYDFKVQTLTTSISASKIKITNNKGKNDSIAVSGIQTGDTIRVYDKSSGGKLLASQKSTGTSTTLSIKQLGSKAGKVYVSNTKSGYLESSRTAVSYKAEISTALKTSQVKITNNRAKNDVIKVSGIKKGDTVKVYDKSSGGKLLVSKKSTGSSVELSVKQLNQKSGSAYVTITNSGLLESSRTKMTYKAEPSPPLKASQVTIKNNKNKSDTITVKSIKKGDVIKAYSKSSGGKLLVSKTSDGTSVTLSVKQLGTKAGSVYVSITNSGLLESSRAKVSYKKE